MATISTFKAAIASGIQRQHRFLVNITFPEYAATTDVARQASILARATAVPESVIGVIDIPWGGRVIPLPGDRQFPEFNVTFIAVQDHRVRDAFERWSEGINGSESNTAGAPGLDYMLRDVQLNLLNSDDTVNKIFIMKDAWPTVVGPIQLDSGALDSYCEFDVTFRYINLISDTSR